MTEAYRVTAEVTAPVLETERAALVAEAVTNLFPEADLTVSEGELRGTTHTLATFSERLHDQEILDTARAALFEGREGQTIAFSLKKAAAHEGRVNFAVGGSDELGEIAVRCRVEAPSVEAFVDAIAPPTEDGRPVE